ncbi:MAG: NusG domain II-containing protein [Firmicutes bacterium]|nr:NusG domain II-containing protein [Bacillota bacterium]
MSQQIKRTVWILTGVIVLLVLASVYMVFPQLRGLSQRNMHIARITEDGEVLYEIDLDAVDEPYTLRVDGKDGEYNVILVEPGKISVQESNCPTQVCVKMKKISTNTMPITCLPHRLVIQIYDHYMIQDDSVNDHE